MVTSAPSTASVGCQPRIRYDNLKAAVAKVLQGRDRVESERFIADAVALRVRLVLLPARVSTAPTRRAGSRVRSAGSVAASRARPARWRRWPSSTSCLDRIGQADDDSRHIARRFSTVDEHFAFEAQALQRCRRSGSTRRASCRVGSTPSHGCVSASRSTRCRSATPAAGCESASAPSTSRCSTAPKVVASHPRAAHKHMEILVLDHYLEILAASPARCRTPPPWPALGHRDRSPRPMTGSGRGPSPPR